MMQNNRTHYYKNRLIIDSSNIDKRIDNFLFQYLSSNIEVNNELAVSRNKIQKFIKEEFILVNEVPIKQSYKLKENDKVDIKIPIEFGSTTEVEPEPIDIEIVYSDSDIVVINKPHGLVVHPAHGHYSHTLVNAILYHFPEMKKNTNLLRFGIVHRLDKDTSGLLVIAKNDYAQMNLSMQFKGRKVQKEYIAIVKGLIKNRTGEIQNRIGRSPMNRKKMSVLLTGGRDTFTEYKVIEYFKNYTYVQLHPLTGRTHQLRVHMSYIGNPIVGDTIYSKKKGEYDNLGLMLCAKKLRFFHPRDERTMNFEVDIPDRFKILLEKLRNEE